MIVTTRDWQLEKNCQCFLFSIPFREVNITAKVYYHLPDIIESVQQLPNHTGLNFMHTGATVLSAAIQKTHREKRFLMKRDTKLADPYNRRFEKIPGCFRFSFCYHYISCAFGICKKPFTFFVNCFAVLFAQKTWIGYAVTAKEPSLSPACSNCLQWYYRFLQNNHCLRKACKWQINGMPGIMTR